MIRERGGRFLERRRWIDQLPMCASSRPVLPIGLFPYEEPLGKRVYIPESTDYYKIVGVLEPRNPSAAIGGSLDSQDFSSDVYVPIETLRKRVGDTIVTRRSGQFQVEIMELNQITMQVERVDQVRTSAKMIENILEPKHAGQ